MKKLRPQPLQENVSPEGETNITGRRRRQHHLLTNQAETVIQEEDSNRKFSRQLWNKLERPRLVYTSLN